jgi:riboflavin kinase/FMN adenylyltransferase
MRIFQDAWNLQELPSPCVATVGNFDGIHLGQQRIIEKTVSRADELGIDSVVITFEPHPLDVLRPERPPERITLRPQKRSLIGALGVDALVVIGFSPEFAATSAREFVASFLCGRLGVREFYVGSRFGFGANREGNLDLLEKMGESLGFAVEGIEEVAADGSTISSTRIRNSIRQGAVDEAASMLGRTFAVVGEVIRGEGRGKKHGWPTINVEVEHQLMPDEGVYASQVWLPSLSSALEGVTNIGRRPTFPGGLDVVVETHLFDFESDVYGEMVELGFVARLRGEKRFESVEKLIRQIGEDAALAREYLGRQDCSHIVPTL